ncbi:YdcF family protein [Antarcticibacterium sp. 1MA-6-2]|uniref:SanA/YdcF family protein n=1 Tax=Antarcticibacterium sp. 1MA-6-2 TaxID=2908210 RepID=UPI001F2DE8AE|nr:ElyC/SanA/YdcF family protein [Antarcticibacterium sp. 1MA-6-2]UJH92226.1 YdcF family protein [Antarcticibacterium sp. 1MA-6-2]
MKKLKKILFFLLFSFLSGILVVIALNLYIYSSTNEKIYKTVEALPEANTVIILGASVHANGKLSPVLQDRVDTGFYLYRKGKVKQFLLTSDHRTDDYDEVSAMRNYLMKRGVPLKDISTDPAGLNTFESMHRSQNVFDVSNAVVVTQPFHLPRTIFIAQNLGLDYSGFPAASVEYKTEKKLIFREKLANFKAVYDVFIRNISSRTGNETKTISFIPKE